MLFCKDMLDGALFIPFEEEALVEEEEEEEEVVEVEDDDEKACWDAGFVFRDDGLLLSSNRRSRWLSLMPVPITQRSSRSMSSVDLSVGSGVMLLFAVGVLNGRSPLTDCSAAEPPRREFGIVLADSADICAEVMLLIDAMDMAEPGTPWNPPFA